MERRILHQNVRFDNHNEKHWQWWDWANESQRLADEVNELDKSGMYPHHPMSYTLWTMFTEYGVLPYSGGYLEQPAWFDKDVTYFNKKHNLIQLQVALEHQEDALKTEKPKAPNAADFE